MALRLRHCGCPKLSAHGPPQLLLMEEPPNLTSLIPTCSDHPPAQTTCCIYLYI